MADVEKLVAELTLEEKAALTAGEDFWSTVAVDRLGIPKVRVTDGPNGARGPSLPREGDATAVCVPCGSALGATWDVALLERIGALLGVETRRRGARVLLAPTVNIHRSPLAGRNFECYSEDPLLSGTLAAAYVRGVQGQGVATTVKHLVANDAEFQRMTMSSVVDERTLREIYLLPFELAIRDGGSLGVMTSYNRLNGTWCGEHGELLSILRDEWGFDGFVISDWFAATSTQSAVAGMDLEMPGPARAFGATLAAAVRAGDVDESVIDAQVGRLLGVFDRLGALDEPTPDGSESIDDPDERALVREAAAAATVLLQNQGALPLTAVKRIAVVGPNADRAVIMGGGSASVRPAYEISPLSALRSALAPAVEIVHTPEGDDETVRSADVAIVIAGTSAETESEGFDRPTMALPDGQDSLIERVAAANPRTVVVLNTGAPVAMPWADVVDAIVQIWFGGQEMANALVDVLTGAADPGGRLPTTMPLVLEHNPSFGNFPGEADEVRYGEGLLVGYRWYEARHLPVRFPFGHGLSYTTFEIGPPVLSSPAFTSGEALDVDVTVRNTGARAGSEVVQCYVAPPASRVPRPEKELKGFAKVHLDAGQSQTVRLRLDDRSFAHWDRGNLQRAALKARVAVLPPSSTEPRGAGWRIEPGEYVLHIGRSSADIAHTATVSVE